MFEQGTYHASMGSSVTSEAKSGSLQVAVTIMLTHFAKDGNWVAITPTERTLFLSLSDNAWQYTEKKLKSLGFNGDFVTPDFSVEEFDVICSHEMYQNKPKERWDLASWGGMEQQPASEDKLRRMNAIWKSKVAAPAPVAGRPMTPPSSRVATPSVGRPPAPVRQAPVMIAAPLPAPVSESSTATMEYTKDDAWAAFCTAMNDQPDLTKWNSIIESMGKPEQEFNSEDWGMVTNKAAAPF